MQPRQRVGTGTTWEQRYGYSRAVRAGNLVFVAGTLAVGEDGNIIAPHSAYRQALAALERIEQRGLIPLGAARADVVRTRMFVTDIADADEVGRAHGEFFAGIMPVATMVQVGPLAAPEARVEIEVDAVIDGE